MMRLFSILLAILILGFIIAIHEFGHFLVAKLNKIQVNEFAIGMGPRLFSKKKGETTYSLRLLPIGGFCAMEGEDESSDNPKAFEKKPVWRRMTVVLAGACMNLILGLLISVVLVAMGERVPTTTIARFAANEDAAGNTTSAAESERSGLQVGDRIVAMDGERIFTATDLAYKLQTTEAESFDVTVVRNGKTITVPNVTFHNDSTEGVVDFAIVGLSKTPWHVVSYAAKDTVAVGKLIWVSLIGLVQGRYALQDLSGPIGTVSVIEQAASAGETFAERAESVLSLSMFITVNVGIFNLLPIPGLDGSRFLFLAIEAIRRKPVTKEREAMVHFVGMVALFLLMIVVTFQDITRLF